MWRIYLDNEEEPTVFAWDAETLYLQNPRNPGILRPDTIRIPAKNGPISADDG